MTRDYRPSKQFNSKLSLETHKRIDALIKEHNYQTQRQVIESAVESLFNSVVPSEAEIKERERIDRDLDYAPKGQPFGDGRELKIAGSKGPHQGIEIIPASTGTATQTGETRLKVTPRTIRQKGDNKR